MQSFGWARVAEPIPHDAASGRITTRAPCPMASAQCQRSMVSPPWQMFHGHRSTADVQRSK
eukprot:4742235-Lingulodinium_polyedra.AAC.1